MNGKLSQIFNWCNKQTVIIWVHGHGQCSIHGIYIDECCKGKSVCPTALSPMKGKKDQIKNG